MKPSARVSAIVIALALVCLSLSRVAAQQATPSFEVASVKRSDPSSARPFPMVVVRPGGQWSAQNATLRFILQAAWPGYRHRNTIVGGPSWIDSEKFDIDARAGGERPADQILLMARNLLAERFNLKVHTAVQPVDAYVLVRLRADGRVGPGLRAPLPCRRGDGEHGPFAADRAPRPGELPPCGIWTVTEKGIRRTLAGDIPLSALFPFLQAAVFDRPLVDRTELTGTFSVQLEVGDGTGLQSGAVAPGASAGTHLFTARREQFWLVLAPRREPLEVLVIDHVEMPAPN